MGNCSSDKGGLLTGSAKRITESDTDKTKAEWGVFAKI